MNRMGMHWENGSLTCPRPLGIIDRPRRGSHSGLPAGLARNEIRDYEADTYVIWHQPISGGVLESRFWHAISKPNKLMH